MENLITDWFDISKSKISNLGFSVTIKVENNSASVNIDRDDYVGTISFWEPDKVEIQFNDCATGDVAYLVTKKVVSVEELSEIFAKVLKEIGIA